jgi:hypothetical protein
MDLAQANAGSAKRAKDHAGDTLVCLLQPDALLGDPYYSDFRWHVTFEPEKQLLLALSEEAIKTFQDHLSASGGKKWRLLEEAEERIFGADSDWVFSFASVCRALEMDPNDLRKGLDPWRYLRRNARSN